MKTALRALNVAEVSTMDGFMSEGGRKRARMGGRRRLRCRRVGRAKREGGRVGMGLGDGFSGGDWERGWSVYKLESINMLD